MNKKNNNSKKKKKTKNKKKKQKGMRMVFKTNYKSLKQILTDDDDWFIFQVPF